RAVGPTIVRGSRNESVVEYSTAIRAGRSVLLQTTAPSAETSPLATPHGIAGRPLSGAASAFTPKRLAAPPTTVAVNSRRDSRARRLLLLMQQSYSGSTLIVTRKPKSFFCAPWNGSKALIQSGSRAGSGANSADAALHGKSFFGCDACTPNSS